MTKKEYLTMQEIEAHSPLMKSSLVNEWVMKEHLLRKDLFSITENGIEIAICNTREHTKLIIATPDMYDAIETFICKLETIPKEVFTALEFEINLLEQSINKAKGG